MLAIIMSIENNSDRAFVEDVYNLYAKKMYLIAYDILKNHYDAEDCVQETIIKIIDKIERFKEARDKSYLKKLVVIVCRNIGIMKLLFVKEFGRNIVSNEKNYCSTKSKGISQTESFNTTKVWGTVGNKLSSYFKMGKRGLLSRYYNFAFDCRYHRL